MTSIMDIVSALSNADLSPPPKLTPLEEARQLWDRMKSGDRLLGDRGFDMRDRIDKDLNRAGKDYAALDPTQDAVLPAGPERQAVSLSMQKQVEAAMRRLEAEDAKVLWGQLQRNDRPGGESASSVAREMKEHLDAAGADYPLLNPSKPAAVMEEVVKKTVAALEIQDANELWARLQNKDVHDGDRASYMARRMKEHLDNAGVDYSALYPGKPSAATEALVNHTVAQLEFSSAGRLWESLQAGYVAPGGRAKFVRNDMVERLNAAAEYDPSLKSAADQIIEASKKATARLEIKSAVELGGTLATSDPREVEYTRRNITERLKAAAELDPVWKTSSTDMDAALREVTARSQAMDAGLSPHISAGTDTLATAVNDASFTSPLPPARASQAHREYH